MADIPDIRGDQLAECHTCSKRYGDFRQKKQEGGYVSPASACLKDFHDGDGNREKDDNQRNNFV